MDNELLAAFVAFKSFKKKSKKKNRKKRKTWCRSWLAKFIQLFLPKRKINAVSYQQKYKTYKFGGKQCSRMRR